MPDLSSDVTSQGRPLFSGATHALIVLMVLGAILPIPQPAGASETATRWDRVSESSACGEPFTRTPVVSRKGPLGDSEAILGPFGTYFGRSISEVKSKLVSWTIPGSDGLRVRVHQRMLPSLLRVTDGLRAEAGRGRVYEVTSAHAFTPRSIGGRYHVSRHAMGTAIDLNPAQNPYRSDDVLVTNMPGWFVDVWREAGFCWGGDWRGSKDPMHFSWMGPGQRHKKTPWHRSLPAPLRPRTGASMTLIPLRLARCPRAIHSMSPTPPATGRRTSSASGPIAPGPSSTSPGARSVTVSARSVDGTFPASLLTRSSDW